jgi:hypothetical protein
MKIRMYLTAQRFENYDYGKRNIENPYWKPEGKKVFGIELDYELLQDELMSEIKRYKVFSSLVNSYSNEYEKYEYLGYSFSYDVIKVSEGEIFRHLHETAHQ